MPESEAESSRSESHYVAQRLGLYRDLKRLREIQSSFYMNVMRYIIVLEALGVGYFS